MSLTRNTRDYKFDPILIISRNREIVLEREREREREWKNYLQKLTLNKVSNLRFCFFDSFDLYYENNEKNEKLGCLEDEEEKKDGRRRGPSPETLKLSNVEAQKIC